MNWPFRLGRTRPHPAQLEAMPRFGAYRVGSSLVVPDAFDFGAMCMPALETMLANGPDSSAPVGAQGGLGDCTCAAVAHGIDVVTAGGGQPVTITSAQTVRLYELACGYVLGNPATDQGGNELSVISYVAAHGIDGQGLHQFAGAATLDATNVQECKEALFVAGWLPFCAELPDSYMSTPANGVWDTVGAGDSNLGHCFPAVGFTTNCPNGKAAYKVITWGGVRWYTVDAAAEYSAERNGGSANLALSKEWLSVQTGQAPNALDWVSLCQRFLEDVGGVLS